MRPVVVAAAAVTLEVARTRLYTAVTDCDRSAVIT